MRIGYTVHVQNNADGDISGHSFHIGAAAAFGVVHPVKSVQRDRSLYYRLIRDHAQIGDFCHRIVLNYKTDTRSPCFYFLAHGYLLFGGEGFTAAGYLRGAYLNVVGKRGKHVFSGAYRLYLAAYGAAYVNSSAAYGAAVAVVRLKRQ